ncbi:MAG: hypothetical protein FWC70_01450 [Defluviitaleaceae bacterium]|nr:hypothetical protein [Defluviitaleaceae bacterium]
MNKNDRTNDGKKDAFYSEELSRAAVQLLWASDDDDDDAQPQKPAPAQSPFVSGFDREQENPDRAPTKNIDAEQFKPRLHTVPPPDGDEPPRPPRPARPRLGETAQRPRLHETAPRPRLGETAPRPRLHETAPRPSLGTPPEDDFEETGRRRRSSAATNRVLHGDTSELNFERPGRERPRRRNPAPNPAVRVNVEHPVPHDRDDDEPASEQDLDGFRRRFNSGELVSPPRNTNRPPRPGAGNNDVRTNRMRTDHTETEPISPFRVVLAGAAIFMLAIAAILVWQIVSVRSDLREAETLLEDAEIALANANAQISIQSSRYNDQLNEARAEADTYRNILIANDLDPNPSPPPADGIGPGEATGQPGQTSPPATPELPTTHIIQPGENLNMIARRYFPGVDVQLAINHIVATNNIPNPNNVPAGRLLNIEPME